MKSYVRYPFSKTLCFLPFLAFSAIVEGADQELLDILLSNEAITQGQYDQLMEKESLNKSDLAKIDFAGGSGLQVISPDGDFEVEIGGRLQLDMIDHSYDPRLGADPISGSQIRRGRIEIDGVFDQNWGYAAEFDYAKNKVAIKDLKLGYESSGGATYYIGHQKQPYSLSLEMSSNDLPFVERSVDNFLVAAFTDRAIGGRFENHGDNWFVAGGIYGDSLKSGSTNGDEGWGSAGRLIFSPLVEDNRVLHLGVRGAYRSIDVSTPTMTIKDQTTDFSNLNIVNTGALPNLESATLFGPELAASWGPVYVTAEHSTAKLDRTGKDSAEFTGWNAAISFNLTGESHASGYRLSSGEFKCIKPTKYFDISNGGIGAWELSARYASIDLNDGDITGGKEDALTLGVNWYINQNVRVMADWTRILDTDKSNSIRLYAPDLDVFTIRTQWKY